jgi:hypothetical protein
MIDATGDENALVVHDCVGVFGVRFEIAPFLARFPNVKSNFVPHFVPQQTNTEKIEESGFRVAFRVAGTLDPRKHRTGGEGGTPLR